MNEIIFAIEIVNIGNKSFIIYIATLIKLIIKLIDFFCYVKITLVIYKKPRNFIEYFNIFNIFTLNFKAKLLEYCKIYITPINLVDNK